MEGSPSGEEKERSAWNREMEILATSASICDVIATLLALTSREEPALVLRLLALCLQVAAIQLPHLGRRALIDIRRQHIKTLVIQLRRSLAPRSTADVITLLSTILGEAVQDRRIPDNPLDHLSGSDLIDEQFGEAADRHDAGEGKRDYRLGGGAAYNAELMLPVRALDEDARRFRAHPKCDRTEGG